MGEKVRIFKLLMYKNLIVRKRHWKMSLFVEMGIPILLCLIGVAVRRQTASKPVIIDHTSYFDAESQDEMKAKGVPTDDGFELRYAPMNNLTDEIMRRTQKCMGILPRMLMGSPSEDMMVVEFTRNMTKIYGLRCIGVVFPDLENNSLPKNFTYKTWITISDKLPDTVYNEMMPSNPYKTKTTFPSLPMFDLMQICFEESYIKSVAPESSFGKDISMSIQQMPYPPYTALPTGVQLAEEFFGELARIAFIVIMCVEVTYPANEKNIGINILMSVNGVKNRHNLLSWLFSGVVFSTLYLVPQVLLLKFFDSPTVAPYLSHGNGFIVWLVLTIHICHIIAFGMHISAYLWKPSHGVFAAFMVMTLLNILNTFVKGAGFRRFLIYFGMFNPNFLLSLIFKEITAYERKLTGVGWNNLFSVGNDGAPREACLGILTIFSLIGIVFHVFMAIYVYEIRPGKYGVPKSPLFCLQKGNRVSDDAMRATKLDYGDENNAEFEKVPEGSLDPGIQIRELKKNYTINWLSGTTVQALKGINVDFYKGEITALLGHNGAGKTTMMSILSGLTGSSEGSVFIDGKNVEYEVDVGHRNVGLCPQEDMAFPDLNVYEQVLFFGMLKGKGCSKDRLKDKVDVLLEKVNLTEKKNTLPGQLSGGQKRRMCLAMAVIGNANVLILDEPTSGMDAESKREVWDIILKLRGEKIILISTHDMEEADILGDRIAIIHTGQIRSYGTSMFLKKLYGDGQVEVTLSTEPSCDPHRIIEELNVNARILSQDDGKVVLGIPMVENLPISLDKLEAQKKKFGVTGMSVSVITLEEIFLRVTRKQGDETDVAGQAAESFVKTDGLSYSMQTCHAYLANKLAFIRKNPWNLALTIFIPCLATVLLVLQHEGGSVKSNPIALSLDAYSHAKSFCRSDNPMYCEKYEKSVDNYGGTSENIQSNSNMNDALMKVATNDLSIYRNEYIVSGEIFPTDNVIHANGFYSGTATLGIPATINVLSNAILKAAMNDDGYGISLTTQKLPDDANDETSIGNALSVSVALIVFLASAVALYVTQSLQENLSGVKQLQFMTGASSLSYWISMFVFDLCQFMISIVLLVGAFVAVDVSYGTNYYHGTEIMIFFLIMFLFGVSILPLIYIFSFWKKSLNTTITILDITPILLTFIDFVFWSLIGVIDSDIYKFFRAVQSRVFLLLPYVSLVYGHATFFFVAAKNGRCRSMTAAKLAVACRRTEGDECCALECHDGSCKLNLSYFAENGDFGTLTRYLSWMAGSVFVWFAIIIILEQNLWIKLWSRARRAPMRDNTPAMDELVRKEEAVVTDEVAKCLLKDKSHRVSENENLFLAHGLSKCYGNLEVVRGISFRVKHGECFGLLGVNGAGKSTTFRMLTGAEIPNSGSMFLKQYNIATDRKMYLSAMGYCPQQNAIIETLNAYDHLYLFARLRGIPEKDVKAAVTKWIQKLNLKRCAGQPSGTYSGGNKRRLNIAMALIGNPSLVLMDEPTTGVDPAARRSLWNTLQTCQEGGQSIILTSHSMEECEVLCNRLVIMVKGHLVCVGASQELKQRFGAGYNIHVKLSPRTDRMDVDNIKHRIETTLVCKLTDENTGFIGYHVTDPETTWTKMYTMMNDLKNDYSCIEDFAVLSSTLEQLFIQFARAANDVDESDASLRENRRWWQKRNNGSPV